MSEILTMFQFIYNSNRKYGRKLLLQDTIFSKPKHSLISIPYYSQYEWWFCTKEQYISKYHIDRVNGKLMSSQSINAI